MDADAERSAGGEAVTSDRAAAAERLAQAVVAWWDERPDGTLARLRDAVDVYRRVAEAVPVPVSDQDHGADG